jgi:heme oxygenase-like protein
MAEASVAAAQSAATFATPRLPVPRGPVSEAVLGALAGRPGPVSVPPLCGGDPLADDDLQLALYACYELHYRSFAGVDEAWEWDPRLLTVRAELEAVFEAALRRAVTVAAVAPEAVEAELRRMVADDDGPPLSRTLERRASMEQFREFMVHRSAYQLKEADPHSWVVPRLAGRAKEALVEVQSDEYGGGRPGRMHASLFAASMRAVGIDDAYGAYLDAIPGTTLATVNLMSLLGLHRRLRGGIVGHLAVFEMTSPEPNRRYGNGLRRLGFGRAATEFFDEHVEADAVHEQIAAHDMCGSFAEAEPMLAGDVLFGARCALLLDVRWATGVLEKWSAGESSLRPAAA